MDFLSFVLHSLTLIEKPFVMFTLFLIASISVYQLLESFIFRSEYDKAIMDILTKIYEKL